MNVMKLLVERFLSWPLPKGFAPDGGISFTENRSPLCWPTGTNLFDAEQARKMFEHVIGDVSDYEAATEEEGDAFMHGYFCCKEVADSELTTAKERIRELELLLTAQKQEWEKAYEIAMVEREVSDKLEKALDKLISNTSIGPHSDEARDALAEVAAIRAKNK